MVLSLSDNEEIELILLIIANFGGGSMIDFEILYDMVKDSDFI